MPDKKISELTAITSLDGTEEFVVNDGGGLTRKISADNMYGFFTSSIEHMEPISTDGVTFFAESSVFDTGASVVILKQTAELTATVGDGEVFGDGGGSELGVAVSFLDSEDGVTFSETFATPFPRGNRDSNNLLSTTGETWIVLSTSYRYLKWRIDIDVGETSSMYAGANNPEASVEVTVQGVVSS